MASTGPDFEKVDKKEFVDIPSSVPAIKIHLPLVGISQRPTNILFTDPFDAAQSVHLYTDIRVASSLVAEQRGLHMSRIEECIDELRTAGLPIGEFVESCAKMIVKTQQQNSCRVELTANYEKHTLKNPSGRPSKELIKLLSIVDIDGTSTKVRTGVVVPFINACPCTQRWGMREYYQVLRSKGYDHQTSEELVKSAPLQAHTNRGSAQLIITNPDVTHKMIYESLEQAVPIIRELLKGQDEHALVREAHRQGQFCEDNIRAIAKQVVTSFRDTLPASTPIKIQVEVDESVHFHNLWAELEQTLEKIEGGLV